MELDKPLVGLDEPFIDLDEPLVGADEPLVDFNEILIEVDELLVTGRRALRRLMRLSSDSRSLSSASTRLSSRSMNLLLGGHSVPDEVVCRRFSRGLSNLFRVYGQLVDSWLILDTADRSPRLVALCLGEDRFILDPKTFDKIEQEAKKP